MYVEIIKGRKQHNLFIWTLFYEPAYCYINLLTLTRRRDPSPHFQVATWRRNQSICLCISLNETILRFIGTNLKEKFIPWFSCTDLKEKLVWWFPIILCYVIIYIQFSYIALLFKILHTPLLYILHITTHNTSFDIHNTTYYSFLCTSQFYTQH